MKTFESFFQRSYRKMVFCGKKSASKVAQTLFGQVWEIGQNSLATPKNLPAPTPMPRNVLCMS